MNVFVPRPSVDGLSDFGKSKTEAHLAKMCDVNTMIQRAINGDASVFRRGTYGDFSASPESLQEALNLQRKACEAYEALPEDVRRRWSTPEAFLAACDTPEGRQEFVKYGLAFERTPEGPIEVKVINPSPAKPDVPSTGAACA